MTPRLDLNFAAPPRTTGPLGRALLALGLAAALASGLAWVEADGQRSTRDDAVDGMKKLLARQGVRLAAPAVLNEDTRAEIQRANAVIDRIAVPWNALFRDLELAADGNVALLAVEPDAGKRSVKIDGEAKDLAAVLAYVARLEAAPALSGVLLASHALKDSGGQRPVAFSVTGQWTAPR
ncbi:MAG: PilN domain-containing protein [Pseudomonadota bacterium]